MEAIYIYFLVLRIFLSLGCMVLAWRISRIPFASTITYRMFMVAYALLSVTYIQSFFYSREIVDFLNDFGGAIVLVNQSLSVIFILLVFIGMARKYFSVKAQLPPEERRDRPDDASVIKYEKI